MGTNISRLAPIIQNICPGKACAKYVCNACHYHSRCCKTSDSECCDLDFETYETTESDHETEVECDGCCYVKKS